MAKKGTDPNAPTGAGQGSAPEQGTPGNENANGMPEQSNPPQDGNDGQQTPPAKIPPKTQAKTSVQEVSAKNIAETIFKANPNMVEVHITSDGSAFASKSDAQNHAATLSNKAVSSLKKTDL